MLCCFPVLLCVQGVGFLDEIFSFWFLYGITVIIQISLRNKQPFVWRFCKVMAAPMYVYSLKFIGRYNINSWSLETSVQYPKILGTLGFVLEGGRGCCLILWNLWFHTLFGSHSSDGCWNGEFKLELCNNFAERTMLQNWLKMGIYKFESIPIVGGLESMLF